MEQHPVPQNVTTFQFRLIGDMTLKQFGYLAAGAILAYIFYKLPLPFFINWPLAILSALGGFGFAFVPVEERPMDVWVLSFFKSIYSPTQYVWSKKQPQPVVAPPPPLPLTQPQAPTRRGDILSSLFAAKPKTVQQTVPQNPLPAAMDFSPPPTVRAREQEIEKKVAGIQKELREEPLAQPQVAELQKQMADLVAQRDKMEAELATLRLQTSPPVPSQPPNSFVATPTTPPGPSVRIITPDRAVKAGLPRLTSFPNVVTGIVKDGDQNLLPGVLVTIKDKDGVPLRALKTNRLGQFAASTPLTNGTYLVEIEDPRLRFTFDRAQITLNGSIVPALEIFAKSQKEITRAKLEKELFGNQS